MNTKLKMAHCSRCGVRLSPDEAVDMGGLFCPLCANMRCEALYIHANKTEHAKLKLVVKLNSGNQLTA